MNNADHAQPLPGTVSTLDNPRIGVENEGISNMPVNFPTLSPTGAETRQVLDPIAMLCYEVRSLGAVCAEIKRDQALLRDTVLQKIDTCKTELIRDIDSKMEQIRTDINQDMARVATRMDHVESQIKDIVDDDHFNPSRTLVVTRLREEHGKSAQDQAQELLRDGLGLDTPVVRAKRLQSRNDKPGLMKAELPSLEHKVQALRRKQNLKANVRYEQVYIRSSQSHEERVSQNNIRTILDAIPDLRGKYRFAGNGRLVDRTIDDRGIRVDPRRPDQTGGVRVDHGPRMLNIPTPGLHPQIVTQPEYALPMPARSDHRGHSMNTPHDHEMMAAAAPVYAPRYVTPRAPRRQDNPRQLDMNGHYD